MAKTNQTQQFDLKNREDLFPTVKTLSSGIEGQIRSTTVLMMKYVSEFQGILTKKQLSDLEKAKSRLDDLYLNMAEFEKQINSDSFIVVEKLIRNLEEFGNEMLGNQKILVKNNRVHNLPTTITTKMGFILLHELISTLVGTLRLGFKPQIKVEVITDEGNLEGSHEVVVSKKKSPKSSRGKSGKVTSITKKKV